MNLLNPLAVLSGLTVFAVQFLLCWKTRKNHFRLIPAMVIGAGFAVCGIVYLFADSMAASLAAVVYLVLLAILLVVDGLAWLTYCVVKFIKKVR